MRQFGDIQSFVRHLATVPAAVEAARHRGMEEAGKALVAGAQAMIGTEMREWAALADSTIVRKEAKGQTGRISATDPLYATGELRVSISFKIQDYSLILGTDDPVAKYQEFGTSRIPPRPFIGSTMHRDGHAAADLVAGYMVAAFGGGRPPHHPSGPLTGR